MRCKVCGEEHRAISDGEEVARYVRGACKCERRERCTCKAGCAIDVVAIILESDGITIDSYACPTHLPYGFDAEDFKPPAMQPIKDVPPPLITNFEPTPVVCSTCGHAHLDSERLLFFGVATPESKYAGKMIHRTGCPKCQSTFMNAV